jgi:hypothetical protein
MRPGLIWHADSRYGRENSPADFFDDPEKLPADTDHDIDRILEFENDVAGETGHLDLVGQGGEVGRRAFVPDAAPRKQHHAPPSMR